MKELIPCLTSRKSKKVLHVVDSHDSFLEVINTVGFWTLEYHVSGANSVSLFVPSPSTWFNEYVDKASPMHEPSGMSDCMIQIMSRLLHHYTSNSCVFVVPFALAIEKSMKRDEVCLHFQKSVMVLSDMKPLCNKSYGVAVVVMDEDFGIVL